MIKTYFIGSRIIEALQFQPGAGQSFAPVSEILRSSRVQVSTAGESKISVLR
jgi:hypothetical protein